MTLVRGGFTAHDNTLGWRARCDCGWHGPWRGTRLTTVESDALAHMNGCSGRVRDGGRLDLLAQDASGPRTAATAGDLAETLRRSRRARR